MLSREEFSGKEDMDGNTSVKSILVEYPHREANALSLHPKSQDKKFKNYLFGGKKPNLSIVSNLLHEKHLHDSNERFYEIIAGETVWH